MILPIFRWDNWGREKLGNLSKILEHPLGGGKVGASVFEIQSLLAR